MPEFSNSIAPSAPTIATQPATSASATPATDDFHELLSELNPLQYIPVIGTIYRAVTGDTIPEPARIAGSFVMSGLIGGPIGLATNVGMLGLEKITGIDPEKIGQSVLASLGIGHGGTIQTAAVSEPAASPVVASSEGSTPQMSVPTTAAWSLSQLSAYGITTSADGTLRRGDLQGSDVLNDLVLTDHAQSPAPSYVADAPAFANA